MTYLVTHSDHRMTRSLQLCVDSAMKHGVGNTWPQGPSTLSQEFKNINSDILVHERGSGYWLWKPYIIYKAMIQSCVNDEDILIYADAGIEFVNNVNHIIDRMDEDIFFFTNGFPHVEWCKADVMNAVLPANIYEYAGYTQVQASVIFFKVNEITRNFVKEWMLYCQMPGFIDDSPSKLPNYPTFAEHRHDQAVLTCLQIKYGYKLHWWPTQYSEHIRVAGDTYPAIFNHHRKRDPGYGKGEPEWT